MGLLWLIGTVQLTRTTYLAALTYTWALYPRDGAPLITHSWSLSVEEVFYIVWPLTLRSLQRTNRLLRATILAILLFPLLRLGAYFVLPSCRGHEFYMVQGWGDTMLFGCLLAQLRKNPKFEQWRCLHFRSWQVLLLVALGFYVNPFLLTILPKRLGGFLAVVVNPTIFALGVTAVILYAVTCSQGVLGRVLNSRPLRHIGIISYSLYLWQQLFLLQRRRASRLPPVHLCICSGRGFVLACREALTGTPAHVGAEVDSRRPNNSSLRGLC